MADERDDRDGDDDAQVHEERSDRDAILRRRSRFIAIALSGLTSTAAACYESHTPDDVPPPPPRTSDAGFDAGTTPDPCLGMPKPCLERIVDAGMDAGEPIPKPCLDKAPPDAGDGDE